jgi:hypothetical protein
MTIYTIQQILDPDAGQDFFGKWFCSVSRPVKPGVFLCTDGSWRAGEKEESGDIYFESLSSLTASLGISREPF